MHQARKLLAVGVLTALFSLSVSGTSAYAQSVSQSAYGEGAGASGVVPNTDRRAPAEVVVARALPRTGEGETDGINWVVVALGGAVAATAGLVGMKGLRSRKRLSMPEGAQ